MAETITLTAEDGHEFSCYRAEPDEPAGRGLVVIQEIFGVNSHIRSVADRYAALGFTVLAPHLFDRAERGIELGYEQADIERGFGIRSKIEHDDALKDVAAAAKALQADGLKVAVIGYCWGGSLAWMAATRLDGLACAVGYYGGLVPQLADDKPKCPTMLHFGEQDQSIPIEGVHELIAKQPDLPVHIYPAGHGFNCDQRGSYHKESADKALERTTAFLTKSV
jgi:carboxymethylenebutenolidase